MKTSEQISDLAAALAKAQGALHNPERNRTVKVKTRDGGSYQFDYATLDAILDIARGPLSGNGLSLIQAADTLADGGMVLTTRLLHASGQFIETSLPVRPISNDPQALGSALTYMRRYSIVALLGLAAEEDDDGNAGSGNDAEIGGRAPNPTCPECGKSKAVIKGKEEFGGGWLCWKNKGGCGHKWHDQPAEPKESELTQRDKKIIADYVEEFAHVKSSDDFLALCDQIKRDDSTASKADNPDAVKDHIRQAITSHPHKPKSKKTKSEPAETSAA